MRTPDIHPDLAPVTFLLGNWTGEGVGEYPTIAGFPYGEELRIWHVGKPFLHYAQRTWHLGADEGQRPLHSEVGFLRPIGGGRIELVLSHGFGLAEVAEGTVEPSDEGGTLTLASTALALTGTAKSVTATRRSITVAGDVLTYRVGMAAVDHPLMHHLAATLGRD